MKLPRGSTLAFLLAAIAGSVNAAPDEDKLGKAKGYPVGTAQNFIHNAFSAQAEVPGVKVNVLAPGDARWPCPHSDSELSIRWDIDHLKRLAIDY